MRTTPNAATRGSPSPPPRWRPAPRCRLWLTGEAAWFGVPGRAEAFALPLATPLAELLQAVVAGGQVTVCSQCAARREIGEDDLLPGVRIAGAAVFAEEVLGPDVQALVY